MLRLDRQPQWLRLALLGGLFVVIDVLLCVLIVFLNERAAAASMSPLVVDPYPTWRMRGMITGVVVAVLCSLLSVIVVLKRMAFIGQGVSHAGFGAIGLGFFLGLVATDFRHDLVVYAFCIGTALLIGTLSRRRRVDADTAIGILLVASMALGVFLTDLSVKLQQPGSGWYWPWYVENVALRGNPPGFDALLFGSLLGISTRQMWAAIVLGQIVVLVFVALFKEILFFAFDEPTSEVFGVPTAAVHRLLMVLLGVTVVLTMQLAGVLLVSAMLVMPGAAAMQLSRRLGAVIALSCAIGFLGAVGGVGVSLWLGFTGPGPCIVGVLCAEFVVAVIVSRVMHSASAAG